MDDRYKIEGHFEAIAGFEALMGHGAAHVSHSMASFRRANEAPPRQQSRGLDERNA